eukprot:CAMPEP_0178738374 /NCGR_PEP_ID=MMETSP0744-20121128/3480_1 /TAXON_ID=913974 /ORGANISM="Nitzschia punctata, Strain CCMP561" /LENGTH=367 /DNA_ID=CAMNT_0020390991 /DNA_START=29 /DNA_END=1132 /DNA_ORIENTATION=-
MSKRQVTRNNHVEKWTMKIALCLSLVLNVYLFVGAPQMRRLLNTLSEQESKEMEMLRVMNAPPMVNNQKDHLKIIDCILYNGEEVLLTRLKLLYDVVDHFYITESPFTFSGNPKPLYGQEMLSNNKLAQYQDKITFLVYTPDTLATDPHTIWKRQWEQRRFVLEKVQNDLKQRQELDKEFLVINTDCDELPDPNVVRQFQPGGMYYHKVMAEPVSYLDMKMFYYNLNWKLRMTWTAGHVLPGHSLLDGTTDLQTYRDAKRRKDSDLQHIPNAGWHLSYFLNVTDIKKKVESISAQEFNKPEFKEPEHIIRSIQEGKDLFRRKIGKQQCDLFPQEEIDQLPKAVQEYHVLTMEKQGNIKPVISNKKSK